MALEMAAELLQTPADALDIVDGTVMVPDNPVGPTVTLGEVARALAPNSPLRGDRDPYLSAEEWFHTDHQTYPYGSHIAVVVVDRETGGVKLERFLVAYDIGRAINPMLVEGQIAGGVAQGMGGALLEEFVYDDRGQPLAASLADYLLPGIHETPTVELLLAEDSPSRRNPMGIKGAGEAGVTGVGAAIASAIDDAIGIPGAITRLPVTPQRLMDILNSRQ